MERQVVAQSNNTNNKDAWLIIGINLLVFALYSIKLVVFIKQEMTPGGPDISNDAVSLFAYVIIFIIHFVICLIAYFSTKNKYWLIAGFLVLFGWVWGSPFAMLIRYVSGLF